MKMKIKKRFWRVIIHIIIALIVLAIPYVVCKHIYQNPKIVFELPETYDPKAPLASLPVAQGDYDICWVYVNVGDSIVPFVFDTGLSGDCIVMSPKVWERLKGSWKCGRKSWLPPVPITSALGGIDFRTLNPFQYYRKADMPLKCGWLINRLTNFEKHPFAKGVHITKRHGDQNTIGMGFLKNRIVEFTPLQVCIRQSVPTQYKKSIDLKRDRQRPLIFGERWAMPLEVNGETEWHYIDTGAYEPVRLPKSKAKNSDHPLKEVVDTIQSGSDEAVVHNLKDSLGVVKVGETILSGVTIMYTDAAPSRYCVNPYNLFRDGFVLDFKNKKLWLK